jgi:ferredoxin-nitrite reductase
MVSCTGSQFCGFALSETKSRAVALMEKLEERLDMPRPVRIHFTGCPNSCGQAQVCCCVREGGPAWCGQQLLS